MTKEETPEEAERCSNPWKGEEGCGSKDICVYIRYRGRKLPICRSCWDWITDNNRKW